MDVSRRMVLMSTAAFPLTRSAADVDWLLVGLVLTQLSPDWKAMEALRTGLMEDWRRRGHAAAARFELGDGYVIEADRHAATLIGGAKTVMATAVVLDRGCAQLVTADGHRWWYSPLLTTRARRMRPLGLRCGGMVGALSPADARDHDELVVQWSSRRAGGGKDD